MTLTDFQGGIMGLLEAHAELAGKRAVVIGGAGGVGRAVTLALANAGIDIATCDIDQEAATNIVSEVEALGRTILSMHVDVCDVAALDQFYDKVTDTFESVDILVNVAGGVRRMPFTETSREQNAREIRLNFGYVVDSIQRAIPLIRRGGKGGSIVNFTTIEGHRGAATFAVYAGAKAATTNFTRAIAVELAAEGIRVNTLVPDSTPSQGSVNAIDKKSVEKLFSLPKEVLKKGMDMYIPQKTEASLEDLANGVLFLVSNLSKSITGTNLHIDGGTYASSGLVDWPFGDGFSPAPLGGTLNALFVK